MAIGTYYGAFNARWLTPEEVAKKFVPLPAFFRLIREGHSVLMGPRGCGKTTLLKMLTRRALRAWQASGRASKYPQRFSLPAYESIYIPSDVRWLYELRDVNLLKPFDPVVLQRTQRVMVSASIINETIDVFRALIEDIPEHPSAKMAFEASVCESLITLLGLVGTIPSFRDVGNRIQDLMVNLRGALNRNHPSALDEYLDGLPSIFYAHSLDPAIQCCKRLNAQLPSEIQPQKWAICFDELEMAPSWLHNELLGSLRSIEQTFLLKLTWNPILPQAMSAPEPGADFTVIRLWNSHVRDPVEFCEDVTQAYLSERFPGIPLTADDVLGHSILAADERQQDEREYKRGSVVYVAMKNLAAKDPSFRKALLDRGILPNDPVPSEEPGQKEKQMDEFFRKAKPIVLLRQAFLKEEGERRTRKTVTLYAGKEAVFAVSEGNPRWLLGLLNDFCDTLSWSDNSRSRDFRIPYTRQAVLINAASRRFKALIKAAPLPGERAAPTINDLIDGLATYFVQILYAERFPLDPIGSFKILGELQKNVEPAIRRALEIGALVHIGRSPMDVPFKIIGERFRLSFMICPTYKLPLRNYRAVILEPGGIGDPVQRHRRGPRTEIAQLPLRFKDYDNG